MYLNTGYLNHSHMDFKDKSRPLIVGSCGTYRLSRHPKLPTYRPRGRLDYQIIYITAGCGHFHFDNVNNETIVPAGNIVLYRPKELQKYEYYGEDKAEVYWIHFTGSNVKNILRQYGFQDKERVFQVGTSNEYEQIFKRIIIELQRCQDNYEEMLVLLLRHLLISFHRELTREHILKNEYLDHEMDNAVTFFSENYNQNINIDDYAASRGMSVSWFIRNFKVFQSYPWTSVDAFSGIVLFECNHKTRQRHVIVDKQINETRQHQNIDRQKTYKCFSSFLALLTFHSCHVFPSPFFSYPQPVPKRSGFDRFFSSYNLRCPVFGTAQSFFDLNS